MSTVYNVLSFQCPVWVFWGFLQVQQFDLQKILVTLLGNIFVAIMKLNEILSAIRGKRRIGTAHFLPPWIIAWAAKLPIMALS